MISKISFGSKFTVDSNKNSRANFIKFQEYTLTRALEPDTKIKITTEQDNNHPECNRGYCMLNVPNYMDNEVENYCKINGIEFSVQTDNSLMRRIIRPNDGKRIVRINPRKLKKLINRHVSNIGHCERMYEKYYEDETDKIVRSGMRFPTTTLYLKYINDSGTVEDFKDYISKYGKSGLNRDSLIVDFDQRTTEPDHCIYFALRDLGVKNIPVYVNDETYEIGHALGLFKEN